MGKLRQGEAFVLCVALTPAHPVPVLLRPHSEISKQPQAGQPQNPALGLPKATKHQAEAIKSPAAPII